MNLPRKRRKAHVYLTHSQLHALAAASKMPALALLLGYTGIRWGKAVGLRFRDVELLRGGLNIEQNAVQVGSRIEVGAPKSHKVRSVPFPEFLVEPLAALTEDTGDGELVFPGRGPDGYMRRPRLNKAAQPWFVAALERAGLPPMTLHDLRHTAASLAVSSGANVKAVQRMLRHASAAMILDVYSDLFDDDLDAVAKALHDAASRAGVGRMWAMPV